VLYHGHHTAKALQRQQGEGNKEVGDGLGLRVI